MWAFFSKGISIILALKIHLCAEAPFFLPTQREPIHQFSVRLLNMSTSSVCVRLMMGRHFQGDWEGSSSWMTNYLSFFLSDNTLFMRKQAGQPTIQHAWILASVTFCHCSKCVLIKLSKLKMYSLSLSIWWNGHERAHIRALASSKSIMPLKADIFPIGFAAAQPISAH